MNRVKYSLLACVTVVGLAAGVAIAGNSVPSNRTTAFAPPTFVASNSDCTWAWINNHPPAPDHPAADDPVNNCFGGTQDAYADAIADGMQIQGYAWAKDTCVPNGAAAAKSAASAGSVTLLNTYCPPWCTTLITGDWKPRFTARVQIVSGPASGTAHGKMTGDTAVLACDVQVEGTVQLSDAGGYTDVTIGPAGVPVHTGITTAAAEITPIDNKHDSKPLSQETATYSCTVDVSASADAGLLDWYAEMHSWVWDSRAGLDLHGNCPATCTGFGYIVYNWYL